MKSNITARRENLIHPVRAALGTLGVSTVSVVNAINGVLAQAECIEHETNLRDGKMKKSTKERSAEYKVVEQEKSTWKLPSCVVTRFDTWHGLLAKADKFAHFDSITIPDEFIPWLLKFSKNVPLQAEPANAVEAFANHVGEQ